MTDRHLPGAELARGFFTDVVEPLLSRAVPELEYAAARLGVKVEVATVADFAVSRLGVDPTGGRKLVHPTRS